MVTNGVDYAWSHPSPAALRAAEVRFVMRYLSTDAGKSLSEKEAAGLAAAGIWCGVVWETTADRMLDGRAAGAADARAAAGQAAACGMPSSRPIYFAADFDASETQVYAITAYLAGAASVLGSARVGIYGGLHVVRRALDSGHAAWGWQTMAWSGGQWEARAHVRQTGAVSIGGVQCDRNQAMTSDYGQWMPGKTPHEEDDMPTAKEIAEAVWSHPIADPRPKGRVATTKASSWLAMADIKAGDAGAAVVALTARVASQEAVIAAMAKGGPLTEQQATAAGKAGAAEALAELGGVLTDQSIDTTT